MINGSSPDVCDSHFSLTEAAAAAGASEQDVRNWLARKVIPIGKKHRLGRWMFSAVDILNLLILYRLIEGCGISPANAARLTDTLVGKATPNPEDYVSVTEWYSWYCAVGKEDGVFRVKLAGLGVTYQELWDNWHELGQSSELFPGPFIVIPLSQILKDVANKLSAHFVNNGSDQDQTLSGGA